MAFYRHAWLIIEFRSLSQVNDTLQRSRQSGSDKEKEFLQKIRIAREEEWAKISKVESEKSEVFNYSGGDGLR